MNQIKYLLLSQSGTPYAFPGRGQDGLREYVWGSKALKSGSCWSAFCYQVLAYGSKTLDWA